MVYTLVQLTVNDYATWKSGFDSRSETRRAAGARSYQILRSTDESNDVTILFEWDSLDNARKYASSLDLKKAIEEAGIIDEMEFSFLEEADQGTY